MKLVKVLDSDNFDHVPDSQPDELNLHDAENDIGTAKFFHSILS